MNSEYPLILTGELNYGDWDCDCACSSTPFYLETTREQNTDFTSITSTHITDLPNNFRLAFSPFSPGGPSVLNPAAWERYQSFTKTPRPLADSIDQQLAMQNLLTPVGEGLKAEASSAEQLSVWLHVTNACNLECPYCYVRKSSERMDEETGRHAIKQIFDTAQKSKFSSVKIKYAGGEATLHFKLVRILHEYAHQLSKETGIAVEEVVLSNGVFISPKVADWLANSTVKLMVSIDGVGEDHDQQRPMKGGGDTFARIEETLDTILLPRGIRPDISVTITSLNAPGVGKVMKWILQRDLPFSLNFYRENTMSKSREDMALEEETIIGGMRSAYRAIEENLPTRPVLNGLIDKVQTQAHTHTCGVGQSYLVITHTGKLSQCQMHLDQPVGNQLDANTMIPLIADGPIRNLSVDEKSGCQECSFRYRCTGGCPLETYRATGRWDVQSPNCRIYKTLYPEALRLEGLRLMKVHNFLN